jgi:Protein of unknown function (DUF992)
MREARRGEALIEYEGYGEQTIMFMHRTVAIAVVAMLALLSPAAGQTPQAGTQVGILTCQMAPSISFIVGSVQSMRCHFVPNGGHPQQAYVGEMNIVGPEVGITTGGVLAWDVFASTGGPPAAGLTGVYVGASGDISVGVGVGANVLFGGANRTIALQPLFLEGEVEVALAAGVPSLKLDAAF